MEPIYEMRIFCSTWNIRWGETELNREGVNVPRGTFFSGYNFIDICIYLFHNNIFKRNDVSNCSHSHRLTKSLSVRDIPTAPYDLRHKLTKPLSPYPDRASQVSCLSARSSNGS